MVKKNKLHKNKKTKHSIKSSIKIMEPKVTYSKHRVHLHPKKIVKLSKLKAGQKHIPSKLETIVGTRLAGTKSGYGNNVKNTQAKSYTSEIDLLLVDNVSADKVFYLCDGQVVRNLLELADMLELMDESVFSYHVTDYKNDFANWINDVVGDAELADELRMITEKDKAHVAVLRHVLRKVLPVVRKNTMYKVVKVTC